MTVPLVIARVVTATILTVLAILVGSIAAVVLSVILYLMVGAATVKSIWEAWR